MSDVTVIDEVPVTTNAGLLDSFSADEQLELVYVAYFGRAADGAGLTFWDAQYGQAKAVGQSGALALANVANAFTPQPETIALYPFLGSANPDLTTEAAQTAIGAFIASVYDNLFGHAPDVGGDTYWVGQITSGAVGLGVAALAIANGAIGADATEISNKITVAYDFTLRTAAADLAETAPASASFMTAARSVLNGVDGTSLNDASVTAGTNVTTEYINGETVRLISGTVAGQVTTDEASVALFSNVLITDLATAQIDVATVMLSAPANGVLSNLGGGAYDASTGVWTDSGTAAAVTTALRGLLFTPTAHEVAVGQAVTTIFTISDTNTAGATASDSNTTITASALGNNITFGSATNPTAQDISVAANAWDTVTLTNESNGVTAVVTAPAGHNIITVDSGTNELAGTFAAASLSASTFTTALGADDTINLHSGGSVGAGASATDLVWVGAGTTVNLGTSALPFGYYAGNDIATVAVMGAATGATADNGPAMTLVTGFAPLSPGGLWLQFDNATVAHAIPMTSPNNISAPTWYWAGSAAAGPAGSAALAQVNVASATSLASALDLAAGAAVQFDAIEGSAHTTHANGVLDEGTASNPSVGLLDWFQFGGNTYIVEAVNLGQSPAPHAALGANDVVVELTGLINVATNAALHII